MYDENEQSEMEALAREAEEVPLNEDMQLDEEKQTDLLYIGAKIITACPMDEHTFLREFKQGGVIGDENRHGYKVTYPDKYVSWSPKNVFEIAYREVTFGEMALMK